MAELRERVELEVLVELGELPIGVEVDAIYIFICLIFMILVLGTHKFDKYLNSKGVENYGNFLTIGSIVVLVIENTLLKIKMDIITTVGTVGVGVLIVLGAISFLWHRDKK